jgi:hypothetical protein
VPGIDHRPRVLDPQCRIVALGADADPDPATVGIVPDRVVQQAADRLGDHRGIPQNCAGLQVLLCDDTGNAGPLGRRAADLIDDRGEIDFLSSLNALTPSQRQQRGDQPIGMRAGLQRGPRRGLQPGRG